MAMPERSNLKIINIRYPMDCFIPKILIDNRKIGIRNDNVKVMQHSLQVVVKTSHQKLEVSATYYIILG
jgi:hypothetical protein